MFPPGAVAIFGLFNMANSSSAVLAQRKTKPIHTLDFYPTPPWAVRALFEFLIKKPHTTQIIFEPACGMGDMSKVLAEFAPTISSDIADYGFGSVQDFLSDDFKGSHNPSQDWIITNPPFKQALDFALKAIGSLGKPIPGKRLGGVALFERIQWVESVGRYDALFSKYPPTTIGIFPERVPVVAGKLDASANSAVCYAWFIWEVRSVYKSTKTIWMPKCRELLTKSGDYDNQQYVNLDPPPAQIDMEDLL